MSVSGARGMRVAVGHMTHQTGGARVSNVPGGQAPEAGARARTDLTVVRYRLQGEECDQREEQQKYCHYYWAQLITHISSVIRPLGGSLRDPCADLYTSCLGALPAVRFVKNT